LLHLNLAAAEAGFAASLKHHKKRNAKHQAAKHAQELYLATDRMLMRNKHDWTRHLFLLKSLNNFKLYFRNIN